jgi:hypothetical protein
MVVLCVVVIGAGVAGAGTSWAIRPTPRPTGAKSSNLFGVSCA